jgi:AmmeMemoRadiSam system protein B
MAEAAEDIAVWDAVANAIAQAVLRNRGRAVVLVGSGDLTHWGPSFDFMPFTDTADASFFQWDRPLLEAIGRCNSQAILDAWQSGNTCLGRPAYVVASVMQRIAQQCSTAAPFFKPVDYRVAWSSGHACSLASFVGTVGSTA